MKRVHIFGLLIAGMSMLAACSHDRSPNSSNYDPNDPGYEYAPEGDMYYSVSFQPMTQYISSANTMNPDTMNMRMPPKGTIARGKLLYYFPYPNTPDAYEQAGKDLTNPFAATPENIAQGKTAYETFCWQCHGLTGQADGPVMASGKFPKPFWTRYNSDYIRALPVGKMFFSITYGHNLMGAHGPIVAPDQRWKIILYIKNVLAQQAVPGAATASATDSTNTSK
jgi:mono/diheme cytochrome c family protein